MIVLDTNVFSALMNLGREPSVAAWFGSQNPLLIYVPTPVIFEIHYGIDILPHGRQKRDVAQRFAHTFARVIGDRVLDFDSAAAEAAAALYALKANRNRTERVVDIQIAGIAKAAKASVATRNIKDFNKLGVKIVNPWSTGS